MKLTDLIWLGQRLADTARQEMRVNQPGTSTAEFVVMRYLIEGPPSTISSLASRTGYAQSRVSTVVSSLVERGWAHTTSDPADGRRTLVFAPDRIRRAAERGLNAEAHTLDQLLAGYSPARRQAILRALDDLLEALRAQPDGDGPTAG